MLTERELALIEHLRSKNDSGRDTKILDYVLLRAKEPQSNCGLTAVGPTDGFTDTELLDWLQSNRMDVTMWGYGYYSVQGSLCVDVGDLRKAISEKMRLHKEATR